MWGSRPHLTEAVKTMRPRRIAGRERGESSTATPTSNQMRPRRSRWEHPLSIRSLVTFLTFSQQKSPIENFSFFPCFGAI